MQQSDSAGFSNTGEASFKTRFLLYLLPPVIIISGFLAVFVTLLARNILINEGKEQIDSLLLRNSQELRQYVFNRDFAGATKVLQKILEHKSIATVSLKDENGQSVINFQAANASASQNLQSFSHQLILQSPLKQTETWELEVKASPGQINRVVEIFIMTQTAVFLFMALSFIIGFFMACENTVFAPISQLRQAFADLITNKEPEPVKYAYKDEIGNVISAFNGYLEFRKQNQQRSQECLKACNFADFSYDFSTDCFCFHTEYLPGTTIRTSIINDSQNLFDLLQFQHRSNIKQFWFDCREELNRTVTGSLSHEFSLNDHGPNQDKKSIWLKITLYWDKLTGDEKCDGFMQNISLEKELISDMSTSENSFRQIYENLPIGVWRCRDDRFIYINQTLCRMLGYDRVSSAIDKIRSIAHEVYLRPEDYTFFFDEMKKKGEVHGLEVRFKKADGEIFWGALFGRISRDQQGSYAEGCLIDISADRETIEQHRNENDRMKNSLNAGNALAYQVDLKTGKLFLNGAFNQILGTAHPETVKDFQKLIHPDDLDLFPPRFDSNRRKDNDRKANTQDLRICIKTENGEIETRWLRIVYDFFDFSHHDRPGFQTGLIFDFTRIRHLENEIESKRSQAENASVLKSEFFASISHEIRTPLNAIIGFSELLAPVVKGSNEESYLNSILAAGRSLLNIVNDILDLSRLESGKLEILYEPLSIEVLARETSALFIGEASRKGLHFEVQVDDSVPSVVMLDGIRIRQIIQNLVANAINFTEAGKVSIYFSASPGRDKEHTDLIISVEDTGIGIAHSDKDQIFKPFLQKKGQGGKQGGTGLGLAICKRLAEMMGGEIFLKSEPGKGSKFELRLRNLVIEKLTSHLRPDSGSSARLFEFEAQRILVVDDATSNRELLTEALTAVGLEVKAAKDGEEAVRLAEEFLPELIIMDIRMPVKDGIQATREIKAQRQVPVIALTASINSVESEHKDVFDGYLHKPVKLYDLFSEAGRYLRFSLKEGEKIEAPEKEKIPAIAFEQIVNPKELAGKIDLTLLSDLEQFEGALSIDEVKDFATKLRTMAILHSFNLLALEADELYQSAATFDARNMQKSLKKLRQILNRFLNFFKQTAKPQIDS